MRIHNNSSIPSVNTDAIRIFADIFGVIPTMAYKKMQSGLTEFTNEL
jgi:hypothetical protein